MKTLTDNEASEIQSLVRVMFGDNRDCRVAAWAAAERMVNCRVELESELSRYRAALKVMRDALDVLKVAVNDKQPDPSAVNFISKTQREADRILKGDK